MSEYAAEIRGQVERISLVNGPCIVTIWMVNGQETLDFGHDASDSEITWNGRKMMLFEFLQTYAVTEGVINVVLHPRLDHYGTCSKAEFTTERTER